MVASSDRLPAVSGDVPATNVGGRFTTITLFTRRRWEARLFLPPLFPGRRRAAGRRALVTTRGGDCFFVPGLAALRAPGGP